MRKLLLTLMLAGALAAPASAAVSCSALTTSSSTVDGTSFATASVTPGANHLILVGVSSTKATATDTPTAAGNSLTYVNIGSIGFNSAATPLNRLTVFRAQGASPAAGAITFTFAGTQTGAAWVVLDCSGTRTDGTNGDTSIAQPLGSIRLTSNGTTCNPAISPLDDAGNASVGFFGTNAGSTYTAGTGYTILGQTTFITPSGSVAGEWNSAASTTIDITFGSALAGCIGMEVMADNGSEQRRPTADSDPGAQSGCTVTGLLQQSSASGANGRDTDLTTFYDDTALGAINPSAQGGKARARLWNTWAAASGTYTSLKLKVRNVGTTDTVGAGGNATLQYSTNGGSSYTTILSDDSTGGWNTVTSVITLSSSQDLSQLRVRACEGGYDGDTGVPTGAGSGEITIWDIRTEGVLATGPAVGRRPGWVRF